MVVGRLLVGPRQPWPAQFSTMHARHAYELIARSISFAVRVTVGVRFQKKTGATVHARPHSTWHATHIHVGPLSLMHGLVTSTFRGCEPAHVAKHVGLSSNSRSPAPAYQLHLPSSTPQLCLPNFISPASCPASSPASSRQLHLTCFSAPALARQLYLNSTSFTPPTSPRPLYFDGSLQNENPISVYQMS